MLCKILNINSNIRRMADLSDLTPNSCASLPFNCKKLIFLTKWLLKSPKELR